MNYEDRIICFIDFLGFKKHINSSINNDGFDIHEQIEKINDAFDSIYMFLLENTPGDIANKRATNFSDSVVVSLPHQESGGISEILYEVLLLQINLIFKGFLLRGGVTRGKLIHENHKVFGPGIIDAYEMESQAALYPRIIIKESVIDTAIEHPTIMQTGKEELNYLLSFISRDLDNFFYLDYIQKVESELKDNEFEYPEYLHNLMSLITSGLKSSIPSEIVKYMWMQKKFNLLISEIEKNVIPYIEEQELKECYNDLEYI